MFKLKNKSQLLGHSNPLVVPTDAEERQRITKYIMIDTCGQRYYDVKFEEDFENAGEVTLGERDKMSGGRRQRNDDEN